MRPSGSGNRHSVRRLRLLGLPLCALLAVTGCGAVTDAPPDATEIADCTPVPAAELLPRDGIYLGTRPDWTRATLDTYAATLGHRPAVAVVSAGLPMSADDERTLESVVEQVRGAGGLLLLTVAPHGGLATVTGEVADLLATRLDGYNRAGVPVIVRFGEEMNGSWYAWGQQPAAYVAAFRVLADAIHAQAPGSALMWAPAYGGGYPFAGRRSGTPEAGPDIELLDTDGDGTVTRDDDPYAPYWPGADAVDWVGMSLHHWGSSYGWGENEVPEPGKLVAQLTGEYVGLGGDDRRLPDFYAVYGEQHGKPVAIPETGALYVPGNGGAEEVAVKQAWWRQVFDAGLPVRFPRLSMVNWVERATEETDVAAPVDWRVLRSREIADAFRADLPGWARWAEDVPRCTP